MKATPLFLGACALASVAGAVGGATTNTDPIQLGGIGSELLPERHFAFDPSDNEAPQPALPDHYAMTTPDGRVEVAELSTRGLYAQQRFGWREASYELPPEPVFEEAESEWSDQPLAFEQPALSSEPVDVPPPALDAPVPESGPRVIDVAAALASPG